MTSWLVGGFQGFCALLLVLKCVWNVGVMVSRWSGESGSGVSMSPAEIILIPIVSILAAIRDGQSVGAQWMPVAILAIALVALSYIPAFVVSWKHTRTSS